jgi:DNA (cytosine-5)-methyltransferase 1
MSAIPFLDIFAGPGGLSEGFSRFGSFKGSRTKFESQLAIEKDAVAVQTLQLRSFYRAFPEGHAPEEFYQFVRGQRSVGSLTLFDQWRAALDHVWHATLGEIDEKILHERVDEALGDTRNWVLLGGPPCQAYSLMGRARMTGIGAAAREVGNGVEDLREAKLKNFAADHRHRLYREYLRIVAAHEPAIFVMENVKGILSSKLADENSVPVGFVFDQIRRDLSNPAAALGNDGHSSETLRRSGGHTYRLYSLVVGQTRSGDDLKNREFLIRAEDFGVPQKRHRVILLGVRDDVQAKPAMLEGRASTSVKDVLALLPRLRSGISKEKADWQQWQSVVRQEALRAAQSIPASVREIIEAETFNGAPLDTGSHFAPVESSSPNSELARWYYDSRLGGFIQHESRSHMRSDLGRYMFAAATAKARGHSPKLEEWPPELLPDHKNVTYDAARGRTVASGFSDRFKVQVWGEPSSTITSHISKDGHYFIHPDARQCRSLTVREAARLQTFPDNYFFCGNRTQQYHQVGNAVPPFLAYQIAGVVAEMLEGAASSG